MFVLIVDQALKIWVKLNFELYTGTEIIPGLLDLQFVENPGMAFGWKVFPGNTGKLVLTIFRLLAVVGIAFYIRKLVSEKAHRGLVLCVGLILAGALGNIIDSVLYGLMFSSGMFFDEGMERYVEYIGKSQLDFSGYTDVFMGNVVDMLYFTVRFPEWSPIAPGEEVFPPVFNIADSAITVGVFIIIFRQRAYFRKAVVGPLPAEELSSNPVAESAQDS